VSNNRRVHNEEQGRAEEDIFGAYVMRFEAVEMEDDRRLMVLREIFRHHLFHRTNENERMSRLKRFLLHQMLKPIDRVTSSKNLWI
jgi:hypothetical protein